MKNRSKQRWLVNLGLLVVIGLLLLQIIIDQQPTADSTLRIKDYLSDPITEIHISRPEKIDIYFKRTNNNWHIQAPHQTRADENMIAQILSLSDVELTTVIDATNAELNQFGLATPRVALKLNQQTIQFGDRQPIGNRRYILMNNKIMLLADEQMSQLQAGSISYIDRHLIPAEDKLQTIKINNETINSQQIKNAWRAIKANWLSHSNTEQLTDAINIEISLANKDSMLHYTVQNRQGDIVLTNPASQIEYHLPITAMPSLGITFPAITDKTTMPASGPLHH